MWNFVQKAPKTWVQIRLTPQVCNFSQQEPQRKVFGSNLQQNGTKSTLYLTLYFTHITLYYSVFCPNCLKNRMCKSFAKKSPKTWVQISLKLQQCNFSQQEPQENIFGSGAFQYKNYSVFDSVFLKTHSVLLCILASLHTC